MTKFIILLAIFILPLVSYSNNNAQNQQTLGVISNFSQLEKDGSVSLLNINAIGNDIQQRKQNFAVFGAYIGKSISQNPINKSNIEQICKRFIKTHRPDIVLEQLALQYAEIRNNQWYVSFAQMYNGIKIYNSNIKLRLFKNGNLLDISCNYIAPTLDYTQNDEKIVDTNHLKIAAVAGLDLSIFGTDYNLEALIENIEWTFGEQYILQTNANTCILVNNIEFRNKENNIYFSVLVDVNRGELVLRQNLVNDIDYKIKSDVFQSPTEPIASTTYFPYMKIDKQPFTEDYIYADSLGNVILDEEVGENEAVGITFSTSVPTEEYAYPHFTMRLVDWKPITGTSDRSGESIPIDRVVQIDANNHEIVNDYLLTYDDHLKGYYDSLYKIMATHYTSFYKMHDAFHKIDTNFNFLSRGYNFTFLVYNGTDSTYIKYSNATASGPTITFYNVFHSTMPFSLSPGTLYHELGHSTNYFLYREYGGTGYYGMSNSALNEGIADVHAAYMRNTPEMDYMPGRTLDNTLKLGVNENGESHNDGRIFSGAMWDYQKLTSLEEMGKLLHYTRFATPDGATPAIAYTNWLKEMLLTDDDDGILSNLTPHFDEVLTAFDLHNITLDLWMGYNYTHTPLNDTKDTINSYSVEINIPFVNSLKLVDSVWLHYEVSNGIRDSVLMSLQSDNATYISAIPPQPSGAIISYYFKTKTPFYNRIAVLDPTYRRNTFYVGFDTIYKNNCTNENSCTVTSLNAKEWAIGRPIDQKARIKNYAPDIDASGDGYCWLITDDMRDQEDLIRLQASELRFPVFEYSSDKNVIIALKYVFGSNESRGNGAYGLLNFEISISGITWTSVFIKADPNANKQWEELKINVKDYYPTFNKFYLRVRASGATNQNANNVVYAGYVDDVMLLTADTLQKLGIEQTDNMNNISVYPNPANDMCSIGFEIPDVLTLQNMNTTYVNIKLCNQLGQEMLCIYDGWANAGKFNKTFLLLGFPRGVYFVKVQYGDKYKLEKL